MYSPRLTMDGVLPGYGVGSSMLGLALVPDGCRLNLDVSASVVV